MKESSANMRIIINSLNVATVNAIRADKDITDSLKFEGICLSSPAPITNVNSKVSISIDCKSFTFMKLLCKKITSCDTYKSSDVSNVKICELRFDLFYKILSNSGSAIELNYNGDLSNGELEFCKNDSYNTDDMLTVLYNSID